LIFGWGSAPEPAEEAHKTPVPITKILGVLKPGKNREMIKGKGKELNREVRIKKRGQKKKVNRIIAG